MPEISLFYGIHVRMDYDDHNPPHFHAETAGGKALIDIRNASVFRGALQNRALKLVLAWCEIHREELLENWERAKENQSLNRIDPLI